MNFPSSLLRSPYQKRASRMLRAAGVFGLVGTLALLGDSGIAGELELRVTDAETSELIGARVELTDPKGRPRRPPRIRHAAPFGDHFTIYGPTVLPLGGEISYVIRSGPEYLEQAGSFLLKRDSTDNHQVKLKRFANMKSKGWWSGDTWAQRDPADAALLLAGEDLHLLGIPRTPDFDNAKGAAHPFGSSPQTDRVADIDGQSHITSGGRVHIWQMNNAETTGEEVPTATTANSIPLDFATQQDHVEIASSGGWDLPLWLASGLVDSYQLHHPKLKTRQPSGGISNERPFDKDRYSGNSGEGRYHESIYHHMLNAGLKITPTATSVSGITKQAPGTYRTYVFLDGDFSRDAWWAGLRAGQVILTNGPLIIPTVNGEPPGHVFQAAVGESVSLNPRLTLHTREKVDYLEFIKDGHSAMEIRLDDWVTAKGELPAMEFSESGWFLIRAVTNHGGTYRYASTAPYFIEIGGQRRISRKSAEYFFDWVVDRAKHLKTTADPQRAALLPHLRTARDFWQQRVENANAP